MKLINISTLALFVNGALAADCLGTPESGGINIKRQNAFWEARDKMCSNTNCAYQQSCTTHASRGKLQVELSRSNTGSKAGYKDCWDATGNIIEVCMRNGYRYGTWEANGQLYVMTGDYI